VHLVVGARGEVQRGLEVVEFACGIPHLQKAVAAALTINSAIFVVEAIA